MELIPLYDETAPIACTLDATDLEARLEQMDRMRGSLVDTERTEHGLLLRFEPSPGVEDELARFVVDEKACCQFWGFDLSTGDGVIALRWDGPPSVSVLLDGLLAFFNGEASIDDVRGLL